MSAIEQEIIEIVKRLDEAKKQLVLDFARKLLAEMHGSETSEKNIPPGIPDQDVETSADS